MPFPRSVRRGWPEWLVLYSLVLFCPGNDRFAAMLTLNIYNRKGESVSTVEVDPQEFGGAVNKQLLHDVVLMYLANQRAGTHSTLRRGEVAGSTKKLFRQKGTGNARVGTRRTN